MHPGATENNAQRAPHNEAGEETSDKTRENSNSNSNFERLERELEKRKGCQPARDPAGHVTPVTSGQVAEATWQLSMENFDNPT